VREKQSEAGSPANSKGKHCDIIGKGVVENWGKGYKTNSLCPIDRKKKEDLRITRMASGSTFGRSWKAKRYCLGHMRPNQASWITRTKEGSSLRVGTLDLILEKRKKGGACYPHNQHMIDCHLTAAAEKKVKTDPEEWKSRTDG